jgi:cell division protein FtsW (lipid II flippase)
MKQWLLPIILFAFSLISLATLKSIAPELVTSQLVFWVLTAITVVVAWKLKAEFWFKYHWWWYLGLVGLLILTLIVGNLNSWHCSLD